MLLDLHVDLFKQDSGLGVGVEIEAVHAIKEKHELNE